MSLKTDLCGTGATMDATACNNATLIIGLGIWGALCGPFLIPSLNSADYQVSS